jgi:hypothetical protein
MKRPMFLRVLAFSLKNVEGLLITTPYVDEDVTRSVNFLGVVPWFELRASHLVDWYSTT